MLLTSGYDLASRRVQYTYQMLSAPGEGELELGPDHSLVRAFKAGLVSGRPPDEWRTIAIFDDLKAAPIVLGTIVRTLGARLLYFPGADLRLGGVVGTESGSAAAAAVKGALLDHVAIDRPRPNRRRRGHLTLLERQGSQRHGWSYLTDPEDGWHYWFTLLSPNLDAFPRLPAKLTMRFSSGRLDLRERMHAFVSRSGFSCMGFPIADTTASTFVQCDFWLGDDPTSTVTELRPLPFIERAELISEAPMPQQTQFSLLHSQFSSGEHIAVGVVVLAGYVARPILLRGKTEPRPLGAQSE
ncbi:MAG TPA: hypothetical protein VNJ70_06860 [Thermoanaerobaculia bacterium]|nr:hypothetical protein [Thermoanaerobaculia bacterium]